MSQNKNIYKSQPFYIFRSAMNSFNEYEYLINSHKNHLLFLKDFFRKDMTFQESILVASYDLFKSVNESENELTEKQLHSLLKYFIRNTTRTTPYGLSAGVSKGEFTGNERSLIKIGTFEEIKKIARPDMEWMYNVLLKSEQICKRQIIPTYSVDGDNIIIKILQVK